MNIKDLIIFILIGIFLGTAAGIFFIPLEQTREVESGMYTTDFTTPFNYIVYVLRCSFGGGIFGIITYFIKSKI